MTELSRSARFALLQLENGHDTPERIGAVIQNVDAEEAAQGLRELEAAGLAVDYGRWQLTDAGRAWTPDS
jgi:hypothetical protein